MDLTGLYPSPVHWTHSPRDMVKVNSSLNSVTILIEVEVEVNLEGPYITNCQCLRRDDWLLY